jgi:putative membrane protein
MLNVLPRSICLLAAILFCAKPSAETFELDSQKFIDIASINSVSEIETAKVALQKSASPAVQNYAQAMITENTNYLNELRSLASQHHLSMPSDVELQTKARKYVFERKGQDFDRAYAGMRAAERRKMVNLYRQAINSNDASFKIYAETALPSLMQQLYEAQKLLQTVDSTSHLVANNI